MTMKKKFSDQLFIRTNLRLSDYSPQRVDNTVKKDTIRELERGNKHKKCNHSVDNIINLLRFPLFDMYFTYKGKTFKQIHGCAFTYEVKKYKQIHGYAMGSLVSPIAANINVWNITNTEIETYYINTNEIPGKLFLHT